MNPNIEKEIANITKQIIEKYKPQKIIIFGSAAWGNLTPDSDLDLFIIKDDPRPGRERSYEVSGMFEHNVATDVLVFTPSEVKQCLEWGDPFVKEILSRGRVIYG